jgi:hypothetical protein
MVLNLVKEVLAVEHNEENKTALAGGPNSWSRLLDLFDIPYLTNSDSQILVDCPSAQCARIKSKKSIYLYLHEGNLYPLWFCDCCRLHERIGDDIFALISKITGLTTSELHERISNFISCSYGAEGKYL